MTPTTILVIPCYNEAARLDLPAFGAALRAQAGLGLRFVDDGSSDGTGDLLEGFARSDPARIAVLRLGVNGGKGEAVRAGLLAALATGASRVGYWDADLATPLAALPELEAALSADPALRVALGSRVRLLGRAIVRRPFRHYVGRVFATLASLILRAPVYDTQCGAKLLRADAGLRGALAAPFLSRWLFDVELLGRIARGAEGGLERVAVEIPLRAWHDVRGSTLRLADWLVLPRDLVRIALRGRR